MPLSDHEQRLLDQIEQALYDEDPKFATAVRTARARSRTRQAVLLGSLGVIAGLALVFVGLVIPIIALSVVGFVLIVAACGYGLQTLRGRDRSGAPGGDRTGKPAKDSAGRRSPSTGGANGLRGRMEDRLRRRFDES